MPPDVLGAGDLDLFFDSFAVPGMVRPAFRNVILPRKVWKSLEKSSIVRLMVKAKSHSARRRPNQGGAGSSVKNLRFELGLSRVDLAKLSGLSEKTVDR